ncbi:MAG: molybdopterin-dependent oxidoreductase, partial [Actinomycetota bacterium]
MTQPRALPPGQKVISRLAVTGEREPAPFAPAEWRLTVHGLVARPLTLALDELLAWPAVDRIWDTHCVTSWSHLGTRWRGVPLKAVLDHAQPQPGARFVRFVAYSPRSHDTTLPLAYALEHSLLAYECEGQPLTPEHGAPVRVVTEGKYFYKSLKWVHQIELLAEDRLGYWERVSA